MQLNKCSWKQLSTKYHYDVLFAMSKKDHWCLLNTGINNKRCVLFIYSTSGQTSQVLLFFSTKQLIRQGALEVKLAPCSSSTMMHVMM